MSSIFNSSSKFLIKNKKNQFFIFLWQFYFILYIMSKLGLGLYDYIIDEHFHFIKDIYVINIDNNKKIYNDPIRIEGIFFGKDIDNRLISNNYFIRLDNIPEIVTDPILKQKILSFQDLTKRTIIQYMDDLAMAKKGILENKKYKVDSEVVDMFFDDIKFNIDDDESGPNMYMELSNNDPKNPGKSISNILGIPNNKDLTKKTMGGALSLANEYDEDSDIKAIISYEYQDPVVRMTCDYFNIFTYWFITILNDHDNSISYKHELIDIFELTDVHLETIFAKINSPNCCGLTDELALLCRAEDNDIKIADEGKFGGICKFGIGSVDCCHKVNTIDIFMYVCKLLLNKLGIIDLEPVILQTINKWLISKETNFELLETMIQEHTEHTQDSKINQFIIQIKKYKDYIQKLIELIIIKSGRSEGILPRMPPASPDKNLTMLEINEKMVDDSLYMNKISYPSITFFDVLYTEYDYSWIIRCETFHLSRSPCVHNGLRGDNIAIDLCVALNLDPNRYASHVLLHTIAHAVDRLYCKHLFTNPSGDSIDDEEPTPKDNIIIFQEIMDSLNIIGQADEPKKTGQDLWDIINLYNNVDNEYNYYYESYGYNDDGTPTHECSHLKDLYGCTLNNTNKISNSTSGLDIDGFRNTFIKHLNIFDQNARRLRRLKRRYIVNYLESEIENNIENVIENLSNTKCNLKLDDGGYHEACLYFHDDNRSAFWDLCHPDTHTHPCIYGDDDDIKPI
jgi:hypothetical protein